MIVGLNGFGVLAIDDLAPLWAARQRRLDRSDQLVDRDVGVAVAVQSGAALTTELTQVHAHAVDQLGDGDDAVAVAVAGA